MTTIDPARVRRALALTVTEQLADSEYVVTGGAGAHVVRTADRPWRCDCRDAAYRRDVRCKHVIGTYLHRQLAPAVRDALRSAVGAP